ncbi:MAG: glucose-6-phosphate isomerase [Deltaproteobacteria bacterium]|nr:glucose-6-phosphate isomerase [Deltaproteobacteria bacterium]
MPGLEKITLSLAGLAPQASAVLRDLEGRRFLKRLWDKDPALWKESPAHKDIIRNSLGWLAAPELMRQKTGEIASFSRRVRDMGFERVLLLGMGGSSLAPMVFSKSFPSHAGYPGLKVLDSVDPAAVKRVERAIDPLKTLFIVASKSGTTIEPMSLFSHFHDVVSRRKGASAGENFAAITDAGTSLEALAGRLGFLHVFLNPSGIGGRFSALSYFGLVPASLMGVDVPGLLDGAKRAVDASSPGVREALSPGVVLGASLGALALRGRDKVTFFMPDDIATLGLWIEQLLAESTGKEGKGLVPVVGEPMGEPEKYGNDRAFVHIGLKGKGEGAGVLDSLVGAGHPVIKIELEDVYSLGGEFFMWEVAAAAAGAALGINPFDQPDVEDAKKRTRKYLDAIGSKGTTDLPPAFMDDEDIRMSFGRSIIERAGRRGRLAGNEPAPGGPPAVPGGLIREFTGLLKEGSYLAVLAYLDPEDESFFDGLAYIRGFFADTFCVATQMCYGPRYLHSTGQLHKGGPGRGAFLIITARPQGSLSERLGQGLDIAVPGKGYTFSGLEFSQALGDMEALDAKERAVMFVTLKNAGQPSPKEFFDEAMKKIAAIITAHGAP